MNNLNYKMFLVYSGFLLLFLSGCGLSAQLRNQSLSTPYQPLGYKGGYSNLQLDKDVFRVSFAGNAETPIEIVQNYLLIRCAELTIEQNAKYFKIDNSKTVNRTEQITTPGDFSSNTKISEEGKARTETFYNPPQVINKHGSSAIIKIFRERPEGEGVFDAEMILAGRSK